MDVNVRLMDSREVVAALDEARKSLLTQMSRAEKAERERDEARMQACDNAKAMNHFAGQANAAEHKAAMLEAEVGQAVKERTSWYKERQAAKQLLGEMRNQPEGGRDLLQCISDHLGGLNRCRKERDELRKDLAEAREQLAKVEWAGPPREGQQPGNGCRPYAAKTCTDCHQVQPTEDAKKNFTPDQIGHRPTCWYARQGKEETKRDHVARVNDLLKSGRVVIGCDFANGSLFHPVLGEIAGSFIVNFQQGGEAPKEPESSRHPPKFKVGQKVIAGNSEWVIEASYWDNNVANPGWWYKGDVCDVRWAEHAISPAPKYAIGQKVWHHKEPGHVVAHGAARTNSYYVRIDNSNGDRLVAGEDLADKPAPRFAVGEWVTAFARVCGKGPPPFEIVARRWHAPGNTWVYQRTGEDSDFYERELTAQTPQYKHDCAGCVFLGRWTNTGWASCDLYFCKNGKNAVWRYGDGSESWIARGLDNVGPVIPEIRRRAVARGLVK